MIPHATIATIENAVRELADWLARAAQVAAPPMLRIALAVPFFKSGLTKWDGFLSLSPAAEFLFEDEFKLHILGQAYDLPFPTAVAYLDGRRDRAARSACYRSCDPLFGAGSPGHDRSDPARGARGVGEFSPSLGGPGAGHYCARPRSALPRPFA
jgi:hypothetical protein